MSKALEIVDGIRHKRQLEAEARERARIAKAEDNRRKMPTVAQWADDIKSVFPDARVTFAEENGISLGKPLTGGIKMSETMVGPWNKPNGKK